MVASSSIVPMETSESLSMGSKREFPQRCDGVKRRAQSRRYKSTLVEELVAFAVTVASAARPGTWRSFRSVRTELRCNLRQGD